ncbi:MAG: DUF3253 domain-containing protein [Leptolyngbyaceae cyanobacterium]
MTTITNTAIRDCLLKLVHDRGPTKTICPSEVARALSCDDWRALMEQVRAVGIELHDAGKIAVTQKGHAVDPRAVKGPIRYRLILPLSEDR